MDNSRDSSVLRSLAVAFGDGLAFGVGMKLTRNAAVRSAAAPVESELAGRLASMEQRLERAERAPAALAASKTANLDTSVLDAMMHALEARLQESASLVERRLAEMEVKFSVEIQALRQHDQALAAATETRLEEVQQRFNEQVLDLRQKVNEDRNGLQNQVISLHREFASAVADIVEEQVSNQVEQRVPA